MQTRTKRLIVVVGVLGLLVVLASFHTYIVIAGCSGDLLWNSDEAYLFAGCARLGYRISYLEYPIEVVRERLRVVRQADDKRSSTIVIRITPSVVHTYNADGLSFEFYTPLGGTVFANHEGALWKWSGANFDEASSQEQERFEGTKQLTGLDIDNLGGWSKRSEILSRTEEVKVPLELDGKSLVLVVKPGFRGKDISIDLLRPGRGAERIWYLDQQPRRVSKSEYEREFEPR